MRKVSKTALLTILIVAAVTASQAGAYIVTPLRSQEEKDSRQERLAQMAVLVTSLSTGASKLMIKSAVAANPGGRPMRSDIDFGNAFITVYPVTSPFSTRLLVIGPDSSAVRQYGRILGAVQVITATGGSEGSKKAEPGVYLLFVPINGPSKPEMPVWLVSLDMSEDGRITHTAYAQSAAKITRTRIEGSAELPIVDASIGFTKPSIVMCWKEQTYSFSFEMDIWYVMPDTLWYAHPAQA